MTGVDVTNLEARPFPIKTTGSKSRESPLVRQLGQGIYLIHELTQLAARKEISNDCGKGFGIYQFLGCQRIYVLIVQRHAFLHYAFGASQADPALICQ